MEYENEMDTDVLQTINDVMIVEDEYLEEADCIIESNKEDMKNPMNMHEVSWVTNQQKRRKGGLRRLCEKQKEIYVEDKAGHAIFSQFMHTLENHLEWKWAIGERS